MQTIIEESILPSEFTFGFELEAYASNWADYQEDDDYDEEEEYQDGMSDMVYEEPLFNDLTLYFRNFFGKNVNIEGDGSLGVGGFEMQTPVMQLTPLNIKQCMNALIEMKKSKFQVYTDESCGFHTHFAFPSMSVEDMCWITCQIAINGKYRNSISEMINSRGYEIPFVSYYSNDAYLDRLQVAIEDKDYTKINKILTNEKYRLIRIHPQGTLEWRGPRNFLNDGYDNDIKIFFQRVYAVAKIISQCMDEKYINGISRSNFFNMINVYDNLSDNRKKKPVYTASIDKVYNNPIILTQISKNSYPYSKEEKSKLKWVDFLEELKAKVEKNGETMIDFIEVLKDKKFKNKDILGALLVIEPNFINYVEYNNSLNSSLLRALGQKSCFEWLVGIDNLTSDFLIKYIFHNRPYIFSILTHVAELRKKRGKDTDVFFNDKFIDMCADQYGYSVAVIKDEFDKVLSEK